VTLTEFLLARVAEDEAHAEAAKGKTISMSADWEDVAAVDHAYRWDPARVLAECEAKRRVVEAAADLESGRALAASGSLIIQGLGHRLLRILAAPCADHSDYDPVWREPT
jgi:hypothetical protein